MESGKKTRVGGGEGGGRSSATERDEREEIPQATESVTPTRRGQC